MASSHATTTFKVRHLDCQTATPGAFKAFVEAPGEDVEFPDRYVELTNIDLAIEQRHEPLSSNMYLVTWRQGLFRSLKDMATVAQAEIPKRSVTAISTYAHSLHQGDRARIFQYAASL